MPLVSCIFSSHPEVPFGTSARGGRILDTLPIIDDGGKSQTLYPPSNADLVVGVIQPRDPQTTFLLAQMAATRNRPVWTLAPPEVHDSLSEEVGQAALKLLASNAVEFLVIKRRGAILLEPGFPVTATMEAAANEKKCVCTVERDGSMRIHQPRSSSLGPSSKRRKGEPE